MLKICKSLENGIQCGGMDNCPFCKLNKKDGIYNWIPANEQLPDENNDVLYRVIFRNCECYNLERGRSYFRNGEFTIPAEVILWRPIASKER